MILPDKAKELSRDKAGLAMLVNQVGRKIDSTISGGAKAGLSECYAYLTERDCALAMGDKEAAFRIIHQVGKKYEDAGYKVSYKEFGPFKKSDGRWVCEILLSWA